jgi:serine/threonine protein kinase
MAGGPLVGGQVAEFTIESLLAEGSTGSVYLVEDTVRGGRVALKWNAPGFVDA